MLQILKSLQIILTIFVFTEFRSQNLDMYIK